MTVQPNSACDCMTTMLNWRFPGDLGTIYCKPRPLHIYMYMYIHRDCDLGAVLMHVHIYTSGFARSATSPSFTYVSNLAPDSTLCRAAAPRLYPSASTAAPHLRPLQLLLPDSLRPLQLLPDCVGFGCCSPIASTSTAAPRFVPFNFCSPIASASTAAVRLRPLVAHAAVPAHAQC